ncbi:MAG: RiPP maturation radical SAM C-methyltransferase [Acidobacteria bacterium]|nr:RiPP maturation radical SAM C-methyltransferase [Acidobacteriota bacterium]
MSSTSHSPRVALVYPPYAPVVPGLGLALLSAGIKKLGFECRTFWWNVDFIRALPGKDAHRRTGIHHSLSYMFPLNEWVFVRHLFPDADEHDPRIAKRLAELDRTKEQAHRSSWTRMFEDRTPPSRLIPKVREAASRSLLEMVDRLAPYDIVGISSTFFQNVPALALAKTLKARWPEKVVVFGGANCDDVMGETLRAQFDFIDYVFSGEVDFSFPEFVRRRAAGLPVGDLPGIVYRDQGGRLQKGPTAVPLEDLDSLPIPDFDDYIADYRTADVSFLPLTLPLESSRGCWWGAKHHCVFCGLNANGMAFRQKTHQRFQHEVEEIVGRYRPLHLKMTDNIISTGYYGEFVDWARERKLGIDFFYEIKANLNRKQVDRLADAGISSLQPGIESFSSGVLSLMKKGIFGIQNVAFLKYASDSGVAAYYNILGGFIGEDPKDYRTMAKNVRALVHLQPPVIGVVAAQYQRFSPMFRESRNDLRPIPHYQELYPFAEETIADFAYHFEPKESRSHAYFEPLTHELNRWREKWGLRGCTLTWESDGGAILIRDRRPGFERRNYRLTGYAVKVFHALDRPRKLQGIGRELTVEQPSELVQARKTAQTGSARADGTPAGAASRRRLRALGNAVSDWLTSEQSVSFSREEFERSPEACVQALIDAGVIYAADEQYLMLPVSELRRPYPVDWINFAIPSAAARARRAASTVKAWLVDWRALAPRRPARQS